VNYSTDELSYSNAGEYTVYVKVARNGYRDWFGDGTISISKRKITIAGTTVSSKFYDGTRSATVNLGTVAGPIEGDDVRVYGRGEFPSAEPGDYIVAVSYELLGGSASNYIAPSSDILASSIFEGSSIVVTTLDDIVNNYDRLISLREAIGYAREGDTITFAPELAGGTITLKGSQLEITKGIGIDASGIGGMTIDANGKSRVFSVTGGNTDQPAELIALVITGGNAEIGGGIYSLSDALYLLNTTVSLNAANSDGGGIYNDKGVLILTNSVVSNNSAGYDGGGVYNDRGTATLQNVTVAGNAADHGGGVFNRNSSEAILLNTIVAENVSYGTDSNVVNQGTMRAYHALSTFSGWTSGDQCILYDPLRPLFTDSQVLDYTLAAGSQAINVGNNDYVTTDTDMAGNPRIVDAIVDLGAFELQGNVQLPAPTILTGKGNYYVSYGANRHIITWNANSNASGYELAYSENGGLSWISIETSENKAVVTGLTYGKDVMYRVRALGEGLYLCSDWSAAKSFNVCPMDINGDGDISNPDRALLSRAWLAEEGDSRYQFYCDLDGDGDIANRDRLTLSVNWLMEADQEGLLYPKPLAADAVFAEYASADLDVDFDMF
ncbi:MAG: hypothetical protein IKE69_11730, partial [Thermoguttaceae bacterium]|nr:hypothetical protein [Thermoguttaceae bacterium]